MCKYFGMGCIIVGLIAGTSLGQPPLPKAQHTKWEYRVLNEHEIEKLGKDFSAGLNELGKEGWELAGLQPTRYASPTTGGYKPAQFYFKRPVGKMPLLQAKPVPEVKPAPGVKAKVEVNVITLRHTEVGEMVKVLKDIFKGKETLTFASHVSSNSLIVAGPQEELFDVQALVTRLEDTIADKKAPPVLPKKTDGK